MDEPNADLPETAAPWKHAAAVGLVLFLPLGGLLGFGFARRDPARPAQPIAFNHRKHVVDNQIDCSTCHQFFKTETFSGLPDAEVCATCHSEAMGKSDEEKRLVKMISSGEKLEWQSLFRQPPYVFYSHRRHVGVAKLACETCHGTIARTSQPPREVVRLTMNDCIGCHKRTGASVRCTACHR